MLLLLALTSFFFSCKKDVSSREFGQAEILTGATAPLPEPEAAFCPNSLEPCNNTSVSCGSAQQFSLSTQSTLGAPFLTNYMGFNEWDNWRLQLNFPPVYIGCTVVVKPSLFTTSPYFSIYANHIITPPGMTLDPPSKVYYDLSTGTATIVNNGNNMQIIGAVILPDGSCRITFKRNWPGTFIPTIRFRITNSFSTGDGNAEPFCYSVSHQYNP